MEKQVIAKIMTFSLIIALFLLCIFMLKSIIISIIMALLTAYVLLPVFSKINIYIKEKNLATFILIFLLIILIIIPTWLLIPVLINQGFEAYSAIQKIDLGSQVVKLVSFIPSKQVLSSLSAVINDFVTKSFNSFLNELTNIILNLPNFIMQFTVFIFIFYFAVRDSDKFAKFFLELSPFSKSAEKELTEEFRKITNAIIYGQFLIGVIQGLFLGLGLFILGVSNTYVLTFASIVVSMIPILGSWLIWLPVSIFLILSGKAVSGVILLLYGALFISIIDNILRFVFLSKNSRLNIPLSVIGLIGGLYTFGIVGILLGPLILSYIIVFISLYKEGKFHELFKK
jgi:predicted PurR-regulated permease PerM